MDIKRLISVVIPVYNEEQNIRILYNEVTQALSGLPNLYEILFIDDGSSDGSTTVLKEIAKNDKKVKLIVLKRNYGQTAALSAGIEISKGELIITMDADLQNDPKDITLLVDKINEGYDLVSGWRKDRKDYFFNRRLPSLIANYLISKITGLKLKDYGCSLKVYKREFLKNINLYGEMHRFISVYVYSMGGKIAEIEVNHRKRQYGVSKYGIGRTSKVILDLITVKFLFGNYSTSPLYFFGKWSFLSILTGVICGVVTLVEKIIGGYWVHKNPLILVSIFFILIGTQVIFIGLLAEMNMRIYYETTKKSTYLVEDKVNC